ncbi:MAG TPA: YceI family protein [Bacteroidota bacterium]|nr:YceI family protein [Bacteroidota bacterium]
MKQILRFAVIFGIVTTVGYAQTERATLFFSPKSKLSFDGTSTLHNFTVEAKKLEGVVVLEDRTGKGDGGKTAITFATATIPTTSLESGNSSMNEKMWEALKAEDHPTINYTLTSAELDRVSANVLLFKTVGRLTIAGVTKEIAMTVSGTLSEGGELLLEGSTKLLMTDFGVKPPTMMFGTIRTGDEVTVKFNIVASSSQAAQ